MTEKLVTVSCLLSNKSVINISFPQSWGLVAVLRVFVSNSSMNRFATIGLMGYPMADSMHPFILLTLDRKWVFLRHNSNRVMMWCMDIDVL